MRQKYKLNRTIHDWRMFAENSEVMNLEKLCEETCDVVRTVGNFIRGERKTFSISKVEYKGLNDMVSYVDKTAEQKLVHALGSLLPSSGFITEEKTTSIHGDEYNWIIDPLDGTTNFVHGVPCFCISVALMHHQKLVIGVVYEINLDECFYAFEHGGAFLNGNKIHVSEVKDLKGSLLATGFPYSDYHRMKPYMEVFNHFIYNTHGLRRLGSAAADLVYVACGRFEGFYEYGLNAWDVAAGALIVLEAGGKVSDFSGADHYVFGKEIIATNKLVFDEFLSVLHEKFKASH
jgi:myo-inositol-1(or 4)-monophosphatase